MRSTRWYTCYCNLGTHFHRNRGPPTVKADLPSIRCLRVLFVLDMYATTELTVHTVQTKTGAVRLILYPDLTYCARYGILIEMWVLITPPFFSSFFNMIVTTFQHLFGIRMHHGAAPGIKNCRHFPGHHAWSGHSAKEGPSLGDATLNHTAGSFYIETRMHTLQKNLRILISHHPCTTVRLPTANLKPAG